MWIHGAGWVLDILLGAVDCTRCPSKTVRQCLFGILRDAWQLRPSLQVSSHPIQAAPSAVPVASYKTSMVPLMDVDTSSRCCTDTSIIYCVRSLVQSAG